MPYKSTSPTLPPLPTLPALQLSPPLQNTRSKRSSSRPSSAGTGASSSSTSPTRSFSLSSRPRSKPSFLSALSSPTHTRSPSGTPTTVAEIRERDEDFSSNLRRSQSDDGLSLLSHPSPSAGTDALFEQARLKLYSKDSEAMQRARTSLMEVSGGSSSASGTTASHTSGGSPTSPSSFSQPGTSLDTHVSPTGSLPGHGHEVLLQKRRVIQRRSTLSNEIRPDTEARSRRELASETSHEMLDKPYDPGREKQADQARMRGVTRSRSGSLTMLKEVTQSKYRDQERSDYVIAVVGHPKTGKSTVIRKAFKAWGMTEPVEKSDALGGQKVLVSSARVETGKRVKAMRTVEIIEINIDMLSLKSNEATQLSASNVWPSHVPPVSGALICYDAGKAETLEGIRNLISVVGLQFPVVMVGCKSDPHGPRVVEPRIANSLGEPFGVGLIEVTTETTEGKTKMKMSFSWLLRTIARDRHRRDKLARTAALTEQPLHIQTTFPMERLQSNRGPTSAGDSDTSTGSHALASDRVLWRGSGERSQLPSFSDSISRASGQPQGSRRASISSTGSWSAVKADETTQVPQNRANNEQEVEDVVEDLASSTKSLAPIVGGVEDRNIDPFQPIDRLYSKLFFAIASGTDNTFIRQFFMTYRRFCRPSDLMQELLRRLLEVNEGLELPRDVKQWTFMKLSGALVDWTVLYPGDFASAQVQQLFKEAFQLLIEYPHLAHLTGELAIFIGKLETINDIDASWSIAEADCAVNSDLPEDSALSIHGAYLNYASSSNPSVHTDYSNPAYRKSLSTSTLPQAPPSASTIEFPPILSISRDRDHHVSDADKLEQPSDGSRSFHGTAESFDTGNAGSGGKWSSALAWLGRSDERYVAVELTRYQWELFAAIRPRDIFRHDFGREQNDSVAKSIEHFNFLSRWVSTLILAHTKAKHRARVYEQFVLIAHQLRKLNNYDSLYAVISGLRETSVHRLAQTHALVRISAGLQKDFQSHLKLMDPRGGYITYRRALQSDASHGRSAIPLLTNVLGLINRLQVIRPEDRRKTDGLVQWDKFAQFADILFSIADCQARGCPVANNAPAAVIKKLLSDTPVIESEDLLFERSRILEPGTSSGAAANVLKRLRTFGFHD